MPRNAKVKDKEMRTETRKVHPPKLALALASLPLYGGTTPGGTVPAITQPPVDPNQQQPQADPNAQPQQAGGSPTPDPVAQLQQNPEALGQLLATVENLQKQLGDSTKKVQEYESKQQEEARKQQTREQQLESDLAQRDAIIQQMDAVIKNAAIVNAMQSVDGIQWNSVKQAIAELDPEKYDVKVDLEKGSASVEGIKEEAQRIARDFSWLVKAAGTPEQNPAPKPKPRNSGNPPAPPSTGDPEKASRRNRLMKRYPVLTSGAAV